MENFVVNVKEGVTVIKIDGDLETSDLSQLNEAVNDAFQKKNGRVLINLSKCLFIDSNALNALLEIKRSCHRLEGDLKLCTVTKPLEEVLTLTKTHDSFSIFSSEEEALKSFRKE
jgi:anti-sigma B factor antagonist